MRVTGATGEGLVLHDHPALGESFAELGFQSCAEVTQSVLAQLGGVS
jgi:hypothetical protein